MKELFAIADGPTPFYLTTGKPYPIERVSRPNSAIGRSFALTCDTGQAVFSIERGSSHLQEGNWRIVDAEGNPA